MLWDLGVVSAEKKRHAFRHGAFYLLAIKRYELAIAMQEQDLIIRQNFAIQVELVNIKRRP